MFSPDDNENQYSAHELFQMLRDGDSVFLNDEIYDLSMVTDKFDNNQLTECVQSQVTGDMTFTHKTYIDVIAGLMG